MHVHSISKTLRHLPFASTLTVQVLFWAHCRDDSRFILRFCDALDALLQSRGALYDTSVSVAIRTGMSIPEITEPIRNTPYMISQ